MFERVHSEIAEISGLLPRLQSDLEKAAEALHKAEVIRRHVIRNPERFSPDERENVFAQAQTNAEARITLDMALEATRERLELLEQMEPLLAQDPPQAAEEPVDATIQTRILAPPSALEIHLALEAERLRIARELHDGPAQVLSNLVLEAEILERLLRRDPALVSAELVEFKSSVRSAVADMRRMMFELRPLSLDDLGLVSTMKGFTDEFQERTGILCRFQLAGEDRRLPGQVEESLYRVIQEAMTNIGRHSRAKNAEISLFVQADRAGLRIRDDGAGFDPSLPERIEGRRPLGLASMRQRVAGVGGTLQLHSQPGAGTEIIVDVPLTGM